MNPGFLRQKHSENQTEFAHDFPASKQWLSLRTSKQIGDVAVTGKWNQLNMQGIFHQGRSNVVDSEGVIFH